MGPASLPPVESDDGAGGEGGRAGGREGGTIRSRRYVQQGQQVEGWVAQIKEAGILEQELSRGELAKYKGKGGGREGGREGGWVPVGPGYFNERERGKKERKEGRSKRRKEGAWKEMTTYPDPPSSSLPPSPPPPLPKGSTPTCGSGSEISSSGIVFLRGR